MKTNGLQCIKYTENTDAAIQLTNLLLNSNFKTNKNKQTLENMTNGEMYDPNNVLMKSIIRGFANWVIPPNNRIEVVLEIKRYPLKYFFVDFFCNLGQLSLMYLPNKYKPTIDTNEYPLK